MMKTILLAILLVAACLVGCESASTASSSSSGHKPTTSVSASSQPVAYINGQVVTAADLRTSLMELAGGQVLSERILDRMIRDRLAQRELTLTPEQIAAERQRLVDVMSPDNDDEATLLMRELRRRRGLGDSRFDTLLRRNAGLRLLVQPRVEVTPGAVRRAYELTYGPTYTARILVVPSLQQANRLRRQIIEDPTTFPELAIDHSTDASAVQGGLLPPISPVDPGFPTIVRDTLRKLDAGGQTLSEVIALDDGYALLRLERKTQPESVEYADVEAELTRQVRQRAERLLMQQLARELLAEADVTVLDPALDQSWQSQKDALLGL